MRHGGHSMRERGLDRRYGMEIFLKFAAYRATHQGKNPPPNSQLWNEHTWLWEENHPQSLLARIFRVHRPEPNWGEAIPLQRHAMEISFLTGDFSVQGVQTRLQAWPMIEGFRLVENDFPGDWFTCRIEVNAESRLHARQIVECIFLLQPEIDLPEIESF